MGQLDNTIVVFTTDNGAEAITFPDGGVTPFKGQKGEAWEGGYRAPMVIRWPGHIKPGTVHNQLFAALDWVPTFVDIAGGPKGDDLKKTNRGRQISGHRQDDARRLSISAIFWRARPTSRPATSSTISREQHHRRCATRTGRCTTPCRSRARRAGSCRWSLSTLPWSKHQARSLRAGSRHRSEDGHEYRWCARGSSDGLPVRLEHAADRTAIVAGAPAELREVPAAAGARELQSLAGSSEQVKKANASHAGD